MIKTKTLLIVGAGASVPYGYPTGYQLTKELCEKNGLNNLNDYIVYQTRQLFCDHFMRSQSNSIDEFLAERGDFNIEGILPSGHLHKDTRISYADYGKLAIAHQLVKRENLEKLLLPSDDKDHWLKYLWSFMRVPKNEFKDNQLKIITFNYDRVIEQYFQTVTEYYYGVDTKEAIVLRKTIDIVHMYGDLQDLETRPYGEIQRLEGRMMKLVPIINESIYSGDFSNLKKIADCIRVIPEARASNDVNFDKAKEMINLADKICFVGFGFDAINMQRLGFPKHDLSNKKIYATVYGMTMAEISNAIGLLGGEFMYTGQYAKFMKYKTLEYLRDVGAFFN